MERILKIQEFLEKKPDDSFLKHALGLEYKKIEAYNKALSTWEELLQKDPQYVGTYYHIAHLLLEMGQQEKAVGYFEKGMEVAKQLNDRHAYAELRAAYDDLMY